MVGHRICFYGEIWLIIPKLSLLLLLIWSTVPGIVFPNHLGPDVWVSWALKQCVGQQGYEGSVSMLFGP